MLKAKIITSLNKQLNRELQSAYKYLGMAVYCDNNKLPGCATWLKLQSSEEHNHGMKIYHYLTELGEQVEISAIDTPKQNFKNIKEVFEAAMQAEQDITKNLVDLSNLSLSEKDQLTYNFLQWFLQEQVEELASTRAVIDDIDKLGTSGVGLFMLDEKLMARTVQK